MTFFDDDGNEFRLVKFDDFIVKLNSVDEKVDYLTKKLAETQKKLEIALHCFDSILRQVQNAIDEIEDKE